MTDQPQAASQRRSNQIKLLILWLVPVILMATAWFAYYLIETGRIEISSKNKGDLINPPLKVSEIIDLADNKALASVWEDKWTIVIRASKSCDDACKETLYLTRQIHIRLNKDVNRVQRVLLIDEFKEDQSFLDFLEREHKLLKVFVTDEEALNNFEAAIKQNIQQKEDIKPVFYLVDPKGWAMMAYDKQHEGNEILTDLKFLLKFSREN